MKSDHRLIFLVSALWLILATLMIMLPRVSEARSKKIIYSFVYTQGIGDGNAPAAGVIADANGVLYGTTQSGGGFGYGAVFSLTPPTTAGGSWTEAVLYSFTGGADGAAPLAPVLLGKNGVCTAPPPQGAWEAGSDAPRIVG